MKPPLAYEPFPSVLVPLTVIIVGLVATAFILLRGVYEPQTPLTPHAEAGWQRIEDTDSHFDWGGINPNHQNLPYWDVLQGSSSNGYILSGGTLHTCRTDINLGCQAQLTLPSTFSFNKIRLGSDWGPNRSSADIFVDGQKVGESDTQNAEAIKDYHNYQLWNSPSLSCSSHTIKIVPNGRTGTNAKAFDIDFIDIQTCSPLTPTPTPVTGDIKCQGNPNSPVSCFDCKIDSTDQSQINILDFSCFSKFYGQPTN